MGFYNQGMLESYRSDKRGKVLAKVLFPIIVSATYAYSGWEPAALAGITYVAYLILDVSMLLSYQNLLIEKQVGLHDLD